MGHKEIEVEIKGEKGSKIMKLLVDTGSTYTWIDKKVAEEIGIKKLGTHKFKTIKGKIIKREVGEDRIRIKDRETTTIFVLAEKKDSKVLRVYALEGLRLEFDPIKGELKPSEVALAV
jgi:predicted aspartyl protease